MPRVANANKLNGTFLGFLFPMTLFELPPPGGFGGVGEGVVLVWFYFFLKGTELGRSGGSGKSWGWRKHDQNTLCGKKLSKN